MEVLSVISDRDDLIGIFQRVLDSDPDIKEVGHDRDTIYYDNKKHGHRELYFHNVYDKMTNYELSLALTEEEAEQIKEHFGLGLDELYVFDISYKSEKTIRRILSAFKDALVSKGIPLSHVLIYHPFEGLKRLQEIA